MSKFLDTEGGLTIQTEDGRNIVLDQSYASTVSYPDIRISVYSPTMATCFVRDCAQTDLRGGRVKYEDTPGGCNSGELTLGLLYEEVFARGYWSVLNIVEISTGDDVLAQSCALGATKIYVSSTLAYDIAQGEDHQQVYIVDNVAGLTMGIPVLGVGADANGAYLTAGAPSSLMPGNPTQIPAYGAGAIVGRRRYAGLVRRRQRPNQKAPQATITLGPLSSAFDEAVGNYTFGGATNTDVTTAIYQFVQQFSTRWPHLTISAANFAALTGSVFQGSRTNASVGQMISDAMQAVSSGDTWVVRVGHDRTPRMIRLYTQSTNIYTYGTTLVQGTNSFEPVSVVVTDNDGSTLYTDVMVQGATNPATQQPYSATVSDTAALAEFGRQIDGQVVANSALNSIAACAALAQSLLNQNSIGKETVQLAVYTKSNGYTDYAPQGLANGDVVRGVGSVTVTAFEGGAPSVYGLASSVTTTLDIANCSTWQDVTFAPVEPDWSEFVNERMNAAAVAIIGNSGTPASVGSYCVSPTAWPAAGIPTSGLVVNYAAFLALLAAGTTPVSLPAGSFTLPASSTTFAWLKSNGTWQLAATSAFVSGAILFGMFMTSTTSVLGQTQLAAVGSPNLFVALDQNGNLNGSTPANNQGSMVPTSVPGITLTATDISGGAGTQFRITNNAGSPGTPVAYAFKRADGSTFSVNYALNDTTSATAPGTYYVCFGYNTPSNPTTPNTIVLNYGPSTTAATQAQVAALFADSTVPITANSTVTCTAGGSSTGGNTGGVGGHGGGSHIYF